MIQLTLVQVIATVAGGPAAMILTVLVGILVNNSVNKANIEGLKSDIRRVEDSLRADIRRVEDSLRADIQRVEDGLKSELQRVEGVLTAKIDGLSTPGQGS